MKARVRIYILASALILFSMFIVYARADWNSMGSGYAVTSNWHGINVPIGETVVVTAGTTDSSVASVEFKWNLPNGTTLYDETVTPLTELTGPATPPNVPGEVVTWANANSGTVYYYAQSTHTPSILGDWGVQALFYNATGAKVATKATSFSVVGPQNVVPEVPIVGTAGAALAMFLGLGVFLIKRKKTA